MNLKALVWLRGETKDSFEVSMYPHPHPLFGSYLYLNPHLPLGYLCPLPLILFLYPKHLHMRAIDPS
jgi:hypothetical protein